MRGEDALARVRRAAHDRRRSSVDVPGEATTDARRERREIRIASVVESPLDAAARERALGRTSTSGGSRPGEDEGTDGGVVPSDVGSETPSVLQKLQKWGDYESCGDVVRGTRLIPMKTPLSARYVEETCAHALTMDILMDEQRKLGREIGLIIDLTNHDCLYAEDVPGTISRVHVRNVAKAVPSEADVRRACDAVEEFLSSVDVGNKYVAVHCAYGFNRTGFMICCYLVRTLGVTPEEALEIFAEARPPGLKHQHFRNELVERYRAAPMEVESEETVRSRALARSFDSEPDFSKTEDAVDVNDSLDIEMTRKHWMSARDSKSVTPEPVM